MKKAKIFLAALLSLVLVFSFVQFGVSAAETTDNENTQTVSVTFNEYFHVTYEDKENEKDGAVNFLVLGDSIAEGYGVENNADAAYARIVADTEGYNYRNYAQVANDTSDLIYKIEYFNELRESIKWADIINICIGSNNYLANDDVVMIVIGALLRINGKQLDEIAEGMYNDFEKIYSEIRELNPDAVIIFNNVYCAWQGIGHIPFNQAVERINANVQKLHDTHSDVVIFDTHSVLTHNTELIADDCVHPNAKGNVELAESMLGLLRELGLGDKTEPVVNHPGIDYNFYQNNFGQVGGFIIWQIVRLLTLSY